MFTDFIDIAAKFQQKARESIQAWLMQLWLMGGTGISLTRKEAEKRSNITRHPAFRKSPMVKQLPTSLSSRPNGHILFSTGRIIWSLSLSPPLAEDFWAHKETFTKFTPKALNDSRQNFSLLKTEMSLMRKTVLQKRMALDIIIASQGGTFAIIQTECCMFVPDESCNVASRQSREDTRKHSTWRDVNPWVRSWGSWKDVLFWESLSYLCFLLHLPVPLLWLPSVTAR